MFTHKTSLHKLTLLSGIIAGSITTTPTYAFTPEISIEENLKDRSTEVITVEGRRNQALTELTPETEKLLSIAGLDHDPLSAVYSMPGVVYAGGDDGGAPAIRGSSPDDNAFYIDNLPSGYIFHLFGDSIFNENVVRDFRLEPAAFGSHYGNVTGGVFDVKLRDPRNQDISTTLDMSLLKASAMIEGGIADDHAFYLAYRRSLIHLLLPEGEEDEGYTIFKAPMSDDYQGKYQWLIGDKHKLTFTITGASDVGGINISAASEAGRVDPDSIGDLKIKTQFDSQSASWQYYGDNQKIMHFTVGHTTEKEKQSFGQGQFINIDSEIYNARFLYQIDWFESHKLITGVDFKQEDTEYSYDAIPYYCTDHDNDCESRKGDRIQDTDALTNKNIAAYIHDQWTITDSLMLDIGLRAEHDDYTDQKFIHPRVALHWYATNNLTVNTKVGTYSRFPDIDTALRKIGNPQIKSPKATHYALGFEYNLNGIWQTSLDIYYKDLKDMARSTNEGEINEALHYTSDLSGSAKGIEWVVKREKQNGWYGWASISWSKSDRTDDITDITTEYYLDTPLLANLVANYELNERWDFGVKLSIRSGQKYTPIIGLYENPDYNGHYLPQYGELNSKTLPVYHRLDLQANYKTTYFGNKAEWSFAMLNALGSDNISGYYYAPDGTETLADYTIEGEKGMEMFPSIGLKMQF
ncbi:TonB-dependent receptor [Pseudocolwellia agarivorans]|uniref:TonB-dependent receptor n=1 Tax=Pseudocolwellia agarivorans TaxID=1911682 RepID=UPI000984F12E|nr:TonB-dependent receptor [Pseudocolwellia agarivorans]